MGGEVIRLEHDFKEKLLDFMKSKDTGWQLTFASAGIDGCHISICSPPRAAEAAKE